MQNNVSALYIELLKKTLINEIYIENEMKIFYLVSGLLFNTPVDLRCLVHPEKIPNQIPSLVRQSKEDGTSINMVHQTENPKIESRNYTEFPHSMIGRKRMDNIQFCIETIMSEKIEGDFLEAGVWRGGATIFMRALLAAYNDTTRNVWVADSFAGVPPPRLPQDTIDISKNTLPVLAVSLEEVKALFTRYGLLDDQVKFLKGWFKDTLPAAPMKQLALLRADGDLYESTMDILNALYSKVSSGGFIIIDDYNEPNLGCKQAVDTFRQMHGITQTMIPIDPMAVYWRK